MSEEIGGNEGSRLSISRPCPLSPALFLHCPVLHISEASSKSHFSGVLHYQQLAVYIQQTDSYLQMRSKNFMFFKNETTQDSISESEDRWNDRGFLRVLCETLRLTPTWVTHTAGQGSSPIPLLMKELQAQESEARRSKVLEHFSSTFSS